MKLIVPGLLCLLIPAGSLFAQSVNNPAEKELTHPFLKKGQDYVFKFSKESDIFTTTKTDITHSYSTTADGEKKPGRPVTWTWTMTVEIFRVVKFGNDSWVLLEHPRKNDDFAKWTGQRRAMAQLTPEYEAKLAADPDEADRLKRLKKAVAHEIETSQTWINLNHVVAIAEVPTEPLELQLQVKEIKQTKSD